MPFCGSARRNRAVDKLISFYKADIPKQACTHVIFLIVWGVSLERSGL
jgi:hypothetical protein